MGRQNHDPFNQKHDMSKLGSLCRSEQDELIYGVFPLETHPLVLASLSTAVGA